jgi:outer membrane receptor protein involved in Fe transport
MKHILSIIALLSTIYAQGQIEQGLISGTIKDAKTGESIIAAYVVVKGNSSKGTVADNDGKYSISLPAGKLVLVFRQVGYTAQEIPIELLPSEKKTLNVNLNQEMRELKTFVTTAGKYEQNIEELTVSMEVLRPNIIENKNTTSIDDALQQVPGVTIVDGEPQIRSGSGYSFGAGSRVMILMDDLPILSGDAGRPSWGFLPVENIEQVEVIKGASSVMYGSAALSGVINLRTAYPRDTPQTKINVFSGLYNNPQNKDAIYWGKNNPTYTGLNFFHSRKIGNLDLVVGGNIYNDNGYKGPTPVNVTDTTFNPYAEQRGEFENRARLNFSLRYRSKKIEGLNFGVNGNGMLSRSTGALLWMNADSGMYRAYPGSITLTLQNVWYVDPFIRYTSKGGWSHVLRNRWFHLNNNNDNNQSNKSDVLYSEYQVQRQFKKGILQGLSFTSGLVHSYTIGTSDLYKGSLSDTVTEKASSGNRNIAAYVQLNRTFFQRLTINAGFRYEHFTITSPSVSAADSAKTIQEGKPVFRAGANLKIHKATFLRASFGQGYRFPTIAEKFIRTQVGPIRIYPNDSLKSETSWNAEIGLKQGFRIGNFQGYIDAVYFIQRFNNNIEFNFARFDTTENDPKKLFGLGFASLNIGNTEVSGFDFSLAGQGNIRKTGFAMLFGYTYTLPISLEPNKETYKLVTYASSSSDSTGYLLKYRFQHIFKADAEITRGKWVLGTSARYNSFMRNIDNVFEEIDVILGVLGQPKPGLKAYRESNNKGFTIVDVRVSYKLSETVKMAVIVNNLLNKQYMIRPMSIEQPRTTAIQLSVSF